MVTFSEPYNDKQYTIAFDEEQATFALSSGFILDISLSSSMKLVWRHKPPPPTSGGAAPPSAADAAELVIWGRLFGLNYFNGTWLKSTSSVRGGRLVHVEGGRVSFQDEHHTWEPSGKIVKNALEYSFCGWKLAVGESTRETIVWLSTEECLALKSSTKLGERITWTKWES
jgi:hypothetical protein